MIKNDKKVADQIVSTFNIKADQVVCDDGSVIVNVGADQMDLGKDIVSKFGYTDVSDGVQAGDVVVFVGDDRLDTLDVI
jgi:hypothetical protein